MPSDSGPSCRDPRRQFRQGDDRGLQKAFDSKRYFMGAPKGLVVKAIAESSETLRRRNWAPAQSGAGNTLSVMWSRRLAAIRAARIHLFRPRRRQEKAKR